MSFSDWKVIVTCEHASWRIPPAYQYLFKRNLSVLKSHQGWDIGALNLSRHCARVLQAPLFYGSVSRLLVELNRSLGSKSLFSSFSSSLSPFEKQDLLQRYYFPYRCAIEKVINEHLLTEQKVFHLSVHSFTPIWNGVLRQADVGLLFDPQRHIEKNFSKELKRLWGGMNLLKIRYNYPYRGISDGLVTTFRQQFPWSQYAGIELELNHAWLSAKNRLFAKKYMPQLAECLVTLFKK